MAERLDAAAGAVMAKRLDAALIRSYHLAMPLWRCPHCGTPQAETARCWVCRRSSTTCSTCKNFRRSVAAQLGYCGLDRRRLPLAGTELRGCWVAGPARTSDAPLPGVELDEEGREAPSPALRLRDFVPVELVRRDAVAAARHAARSNTAGSSQAGSSAQAVVPTEPETMPAWSDRVTLFGEAEL